MYHRNIFGSSSKVFGNLQTSLDIFGNSRKMFGNVRLVFGTILENLRKSSESGRKSSESGRKSSENHKKRRYQYVYIIKRTIYTLARRYEFFVTRGKGNISLMRYCSCHSNIKFISSRHRVISSISLLPPSLRQWLMLVLCFYKVIDLKHNFKPIIVDIFGDYMYLL